MSSNDSDAKWAAVFSSSVARIADRTVVGFIGDIDARSAGTFRNQLLSLAKEHPKSIVIDMESVQHVDPQAVAVLLEVLRFTREHGIALTVRATRPPVRDAFADTPVVRLLARG